MVLISLLLAGSLLLTFSGRVKAAEPVGNEFLGSVFADGDDAPNGLELRTEVDGVNYGSTAILNTPGVGTFYVMGTEGDDTATPEKDGIVTGDLMVSWVEGYICDETYSDWQPGQVIFGVPIPTVTNLDLHYSTTGQPVMLKINEVMPHPSSGPDWIEIYNPSVQTVNLSQYRLEKDGGFTQPLSGTLDAHGFEVVDLVGGNVLSDSGQDEIKISWQDLAGMKAGGNWVVIDRMEYGTGGTGPDDTAPSNGDMGNAATPPRDVSLELSPDGADTNHPNIDYFISSRPESTPGYTNTEVQPLITVTSPPSGVSNADLNFTIAWTDDDPDDNADINLYYDQDGVVGGETLIVNLPMAEDADGPGDRYLWDASTVPVGLYYVKAVISDRITPPMYSFSPGRVAITHPPDITVLQPDGVGDLADSIYNIQWVDSDGDDNATITLSYDTDTNPGGEVLIGQVPWGEDPDGIWDTYPWNLDSVPQGQYYVKAVIFDGSQSKTSYSPGPLTVIHPPSIRVLQPDSPDEPSHRAYRIQWTDRDANDNATISLWFDTDTIRDADEVKIADIAWGEDPDGPSFDSYVWNTTMVHSGTYYILAVIDDGKTANYSYSIGSVRVEPNRSPGINILEPLAPREADEKFVVTWIDWDDDDNATISLWYDNDTVAGGEMKIADIPWGEDPDGSFDSYVWNTTTVPEGTYYIKAVISDGLETVRVYSIGTVHVVHPKGVGERAVGEFPLMIITAIIFAVFATILLLFYMRKRNEQSTAEPHRRPEEEKEVKSRKDKEKEATENRQDLS